MGNAPGVTALERIHRTVSGARQNYCTNSGQHHRSLARLEAKWKAMPLQFGFLIVISCLLDRPCSPSGGPYQLGCVFQPHHLWFAYVPHAKPLLHLMLHHVLQLDSLTSCRIDVTLLVAHGSNIIELLGSAQQVALSARLLQERQLGAFLCRFDTYTIPTDQLAPSRITVKSAVTIEHILDLSDSNPSNCTFCIPTDHPNPRNPLPVEYTLTGVVASMTNLTKLHLTIADSYCISTIDFQPLSQLGLLEDLALQVLRWQEPECCHGVLRSNRQSLQFVTFTADSWTAATYCSLQLIVQLKTLNISIMNANTDQAQALGGVTAELFRLTLHMNGAKSDDIFQALQDSQPNIHELTLRKQRCCDICRPPLLPRLRSLTLRECSSLTGKSFPSYPRVT